MTTEEWKDIKDYEGYYKISNLGRVKSLARISSHNHFVKEKIKKFSIDWSGYFYVKLWKSCKSKIKKIHRLVAEAFLENPLDLPTVNHKNGNKQDNLPQNLEWMTFGQNNIHAIKNKLRVVPYGENHCRSRLKECDIINIRNDWKTGNFTQKELEKKY